MNPFLHLTTPTNLGSEREKFLGSSSYHPVFQYDWSIPVLSSHPLKLKLLQAVLNQDHLAIIKLAQDLFEVAPSQELRQQAATAVSNRSKVSISGSAEDFSRLLSQAFSKFEIPYTVNITSLAGFNARPEHSRRRIQVSKQIHFEMFSMEGGVRHDLVHIMRKLNGVHNQLANDPDYLPSEEGLASYAQDHVAGVSDNGLVQHALEYLGTEVGLKGSLRDIYELMRDHGMSSELAWKRASRHKFGFVKTKEPGDIIKPAMYFANELKIKVLTRNERLRLFVGKISIKNLPKHPDYHGLWSPDRLIEYFNL